MNFNVWNIKEMLSIPSGPGTTKPSNWNSNQTDGSLSDSQFLFGSQFCPENSETLLTSLDTGAYSRHPKQTQQNSVDNEPSIFTKYQTKPQLFGGDAKDEGLFSLPLPAGKSKGLLKQFEEKKRNATDKCDSEMLYNFVSHFQEAIYKLQTSVEKSEEHLSSSSQSILDSLETIAKTFQETARVQHDLMVEAVQDRGHVEQAIHEIQKSFEARQGEFIEMKSNLKNLEVLVAQQNKNLQQLCENLGQLNVPSVLEELKKFASAPQVARHLKDSTSQTSPSQAQSPHFTVQEKYPSEEPASWQPAVNPSRNSQRPWEFGVWDAGAGSNGFGKAALATSGTHRGKEHVRNKTMQTYCKNWVMTTRSLSNHCANLPSQKAANDQDLIVQESSQLALNKFELRVKNVCPKYEAQSMCSFDPFEQSETEQKGSKGRRGRKGRKQTPRKACAFTSKHHSSQSPVSSPQGPLTCWVAPRGSTVAGQENLRQSTQSSSTDSELVFSISQRDQQINWFGDLSLKNPEPPLCKKRGKNLLCDPDFDSSDDNF